MTRAFVVVLLVAASSGARADLKIPDSPGDDAVAAARKFFDAAERGDWSGASFGVPFFFCERTYHYQDITAFEGSRRRLRYAPQVRELLGGTRPVWSDPDNRLRLAPRADQLGRPVAEEMIARCRPPAGVRVYLTNDSVGVDYPEILIVGRGPQGARVIGWLRPHMLCDEDPC